MKKLIHGKLCIECEEKRALFILHGKVKWDADHKLCRKCYRALRNKWRVLHCVTF